MDPNALLMDGRDNVVTCIKDISAGEEIVYYLEGERKTLRAEEAIPFCHKASRHRLHSKRRLGLP